MNGAGDALQITSPRVAFDAPQLISFPLGAPNVEFERADDCVFGKAPPISSLNLDAMPMGIVAVRSVHFEAPLAPVFASAAPATPRPPAPPAVATPKTHVRLRPPAEAIKLEDRLYYVLQPPLDVWMAGESLEVPFHPFPYQLEGIAFLYPRFAAVLADEMGLGKTMQAITALRLLLRSGDIRSALVVCPKPLVSNWVRELTQWAPEIPVMPIAGDQEQRAWKWSLTDCPIKLANYEVLVRDRDLLRDAQVRPDLVILDESQRIKNRDSATAQVVRSIPRKRSWALTGTPIENRAEDLVGIFDFVAPGHLSAEMKPGRMGRLAADYLLRRRKEQVLTELPPKLVRDAPLELGPRQRETYRLAEEEGVLQLTQMGEAATIQHVFELVLRLKQICNFDPATGESTKFERLAADIEEVVASGQKAIIFSQWVSTLQTLAEWLAEFKPAQFHGRVPTGERDGVLHRFRHDANCPLLLISYGAGGVGLNLQFASYVFLFDRWWNPAVEDQAINRAHRIGATSPVTVTRFLAQGTIEERIAEVLDQKRAIFDAVLSDADGQTRQDFGLTREEVFGLFNLRCPARQAA